MGPVDVPGDTSEENQAPSRHFGLSDGERPSAGIRRIALGRVEDALEQLGGAGDAEVAKRVHEARKDLKKLRAVLRLVRSEVPADVYRSANERFREAGRKLSSARDAEVKLDTLRSLREHYPADFPPLGANRLEAALMAERDALEASLRADGARLSSAREAIEAAREPIASLPLGTDGWALVGGGLDRAYRRGRSLFEVAVADPSDHNVHEWRKRAKELWYHLRILECIWEPVVGQMAQQAHELGDLLGDHHDLAVLIEDAESREGMISAPMRERLAILAERRQAELLAEARRVGERLYAERPKAFRRRMRSYWRIWRAEQA